MRKLFPLILLSITSIALATHSQPVKVFINGQTVKIGINLTCPSRGLSMIASPNIIISQDNTHFDIIMSYPAPDGIVCSPLPHEYIDEGRDYFDLGALAPGEYTISANYVGNDTSLPPQPGVEVFEFDQTSFFVAHPVPAINNIGIILMLLLIGLVTKRFRKKIQL